MLIKHTVLTLKQIFNLKFACRSEARKAYYIVALKQTSI